jgi:FAD/FMN-containing dehydrogenase
MKPEAMAKAAFLEHVHGADRVLFELVQAHRGSISAEHGIGLLKREWMPFSRTPEELATMRALKAALDPKGILNPGKVLPDPA